MADTMLGNESKEEKKTVTYLCEVKCYWKGKLYLVDTKYDFEATVTPPKEYFKKL